jgi:hypothetical protein
MQGWRATWDLVPVVAPYRNGWELSALDFLVEFSEKVIYEKTSDMKTLTLLRRVQLYETNATETE